MAIKRVPTRNGKGFIVTGRRNSREWDDFLETAGGCVGVTSVNHRAVQRAKASESEEDRDE